MPSLKCTAEPGSFLLCAVTLELVRLDILQRLFLADSHALWLSVAKLTFVRKTEVMGKCHRPGRAGRDAQLASDAQAGVENYSCKVEVPCNGLFRAYSHTRGIGALLARERNKETPITGADTHDFDPFARNSPIVGVSRGTGCLAVLAAVALKGIYDKNFRHQG